MSGPIKSISSVEHQLIFYWHSTGDWALGLAHALPMSHTPASYVFQKPNSAQELFLMKFVFIELWSVCQQETVFRCWWYLFNMSSWISEASSSHLSGKTSKQTTYSIFLWLVKIMFVIWKGKVIFSGRLYSRWRDVVDCLNHAPYVLLFVQRSIWKGSGE